MAPVRCQHSAVLAMALAALVYGLGVGASLGHAAIVGYVPGRVLVKFYPGTPASNVARAHANAHARFVREIPQIGVEVVDLAPGMTVEKGAGFYAHNPNVEFVEPDWVAEPEAVPDDPSYPTQWHLPKIGGPSAWDTTTGSSGIIVAILDTGVDPTHPDMAPKLVPGWNAYDGTSDTHDVYGHGTATAGSAAAIGNNEQGVASVAWNCRIMPIRISDGNGYAYYSTAAAGLTWAADHGARVANLSYEFSGAASVQEAAKYFQSKGGVVTISAGNGGSALSLPDNPYVLTVGATDSSDCLASFSNTGNVIDVVAPGVDILTTANGGGYRSASGTSFSAPITAGVAALVLSANPSLTGQQAQDIIRQSADDLGAAGRDPQFGCGRVNAARAVALALQGARDTQPPTVAFATPANGAMLSGVVQVQVSASDNAGVASVSVRVDNGTPFTDTSAPYTFSWDTTAVPDGPHTLTATATDTSGNTATAQLGVTVTNAPPPDTTPPTVSFAAPANGATVAGVVQIQLSASDSVAVASVSVRVDNGTPFTDTSAPYTFSWDTTAVSDGPHTLTATATDTSGNTATAQLTVAVSNVSTQVIDAEPPTVQIVSPPNGSRTSGSVTVRVNASDNVGVVRVELYTDRVVVGTSTSASPSFRLNTRRWTRGTHVLQAAAYDAAGNCSWSQPVTIYR